MTFTPFGKVFPNLDTVAADIAIEGNQALGVNSFPAPSDHVHPAASWVPADNGLVTASTDPVSGSSSSVLTAGTVYLVKLWARKAITITNLLFCISAGGTGASTGSFLGLYDSSGNRLAVTTDIGAQLTAGGSVTGALGAAQNIAAGAFVWGALVVNLATTQPSIFRGSTSAGLSNIGLPVSASRYATGPTLQTTLPATITPASLVTTSAWWMGAS